MDTKPFVSQCCSADYPVDIDCTTLEPPSMSSDAKPSLDVTSEPDVITSLLPRLAARKLKDDESEEFFIDLGKNRCFFSILPSVSFVLFNIFLSSYLSTSIMSIVKA